MKPKYTENRIYQTQCACGHSALGTYPTEVIAAVSYGPGIESLIGYFYSRQYLSFMRLKELLNNVFNISIS